MFTPVTIVTASVSVLPETSFSPLGYNAFVDEEKEAQGSGSLPKDSAS